MSITKLALALATAMTLTACSLPRERGYAETRELVRSASGIAPPAPRLLAPAPLPDRPVTAADATRLALLHHPRVREAFASIGAARADWEDAARVGNPSFSFLSLAPSGGASAITRALTLSLSDIVLLPARKRLAQGELERAQSAAAAELLALAQAAESAWYEAVGAAQIAAMRALVAEAANASETLAQRFFDAGNISRLELELERAAAAQARIDAIDAEAHAVQARATLANFIGQRSSADWQLARELPAPLPGEFQADAMVTQALDERLDLRAARQALAAAEDALGATQRWRWLGAAEIGGEREREAGGERLRGPSLAVELPLFGQGQGAIERARSERHAKRAALDALALEVHNEAATAIDGLNAARAIAERYAQELVPRREAIVARTQERVNFMLAGVFELLLARQHQFDAYQSYLEAVRDYWIARAALRKAVGGRLPDDGAVPKATIGVDALLSKPGVDPHADHDSPTHAPETDPHAGHRRSATPPETDPPSARRERQPDSNLDAGEMP